MKKKFRYFLMFFIGILLCMYGFFSYMNNKEEGKIKNDIKNFCITNKRDLVIFASGKMSQEDFKKKFTNINIKKDHKFPDVIDFDFAGRGLGSASIYYGFYYIKNDDIEKTFNKIFEKKDHDLWYFKEKNSDSSITIEKISPNWYYYKKTY